MRFRPYLVSLVLTSCKSQNVLRLPLFFNAMEPFLHPPNFSVDSIMSWFILRYFVDYFFPRYSRSPFRYFLPYVITVSTAGAMFSAVLGAICLIEQAAKLYLLRIYLVPGDSRNTAILRCSRIHLSPAR